MKKKSIAYYTTDTRELAPFPNMTSEDLRAYEKWMQQLDEDELKLFWPIMLIIFIIANLAIFGN